MLLRMEEGIGVTTTVDVIFRGKGPGILEIIGMELPALACVDTGNEGTETMDDRGSTTVSVGTNVRSLLVVIGGCP